MITQTTSSTLSLDLCGLHGGGWSRGHVVSNVWKGASYVNEGGEGGTYPSEFKKYLVGSLKRVLTTAKRNLCSKSNFRITRVCSSLLCQLNCEEVADFANGLLP